MATVRQTGPEGVSDTRKEVAAVPLAPSPIALPSPSQATPAASQLPATSELRKEFRLGSEKVLHRIQAPPEREQLQHYSPSGGHSRGPGEGKFSSGQTSEQGTWPFTVLGERNGQR